MVSRHQLMKVSAAIPALSALSCRGLHCPQQPARIFGRGVHTARIGAAREPSVRFIRRAWAAAALGAATTVALASSPASSSSPPPPLSHEADAVPPSYETDAAPPETRREGPLKELYPPLEPYNSGCLRVPKVHSIYWEESGNPQGKPVVFLHGGPGSGCSAGSRQFFDPAKYRIVCIDQRGAGRSTPRGCLEDNTTWHLVADIERVRELLGIDKWQVFGGSWGSTLALSYAESHPERVQELVLRGVFMLRPQELKWFYQEGANFIFPDAWEAYKEAIPPEERSDYLLAYRKRLTSPNDAVRLAAAKAWSKWEMSFARIENHFFIHQGWFPHPDYLLSNVDRVRHIPAVIVQGRYDVVCPMITSWELHRAWPEAEYIVSMKARSLTGHSAVPPPIISELVTATDRFADGGGKERQ
ncbi:prolyl aminopeptidase [Tribonema minus]|uniref:Proline iminopeptidase n=1 Tax=Tribonema minus TaxID=303371 RepID=A0A836CG97_9STRA|nr:prolyl aminopeptidase [Tribonema minus]